MKEEEHSKSNFNNYLWHQGEGIFNYDTLKRNKYKFYKAIDEDIILNDSLSINDKAVYLGILKFASFTKNYKTKISSSEIESACGVKRQSQTKSIKKLKNTGLIQVFGSRYENRFIIKPTKKFLPIRLNSLGGLKFNRKYYIRLLTGIILSNGNNCIPMYKTCKKRIAKLTKVEYQKIKSIYYQYEEYNEDLDINNYERL